jgi:hypothetical protein
VAVCDGILRTGEGRSLGQLARGRTRRKDQAADGEGTRGTRASSPGQSSADS